MTQADLHQLTGVGRFVLGLDLGKVTDPSALAVLECFGEREKAQYHVRSLKRWDLGTPYPVITADLKRMLLCSPFSARRPRLAADGTGCGLPVIDDMKRAGLNAQIRTIISTAGHTVTPADGGWHVPKRFLIAAAQVALQNGRLLIARALPEAEALVEELKNYRVRISESGAVTFGNSTNALDWRDPTMKHDDLTMALCIALWLAQQQTEFTNGRVIYSFSDFSGTAR